MDANIEFTTSMNFLSPKQHYWKWKFLVAQTNFAALHSELPINMQMVLISVFGRPSSTPHQRFVKCCSSETVTFESDYFEGHNKRSYNSVQSKYPNK